MEWICPNGHSLWKWNSQPTLKFGMQAGDFMMATNILLSGNNYTKVALLFKFMNVGMVERSSFFKIQDTYCVDTIKDFWNEKRKEIITRLKSRDNVVALADGRMDSPGHCAQYCTYTTMEKETKEIISIVTIDKRETQGNSVIMEKVAFVRTFDQLLQEVKLTEICTDMGICRFLPSSTRSVENTKTLVSSILLICGMGQRTWERKSLRQDSREDKQSSYNGPKTFPITSGTVARWRKTIVSSLLCGLDFCTMSPTSTLGPWEPACMSPWRMTPTESG
ncbi:hypothetical protein UPYG_G00289710 [Umbra pygmaea]|uniref:Uncharacterized protein n=1 Tax=Umbra pygmaea TaxID=75934 RepID=A0ABD0WP08_UMBPY